MRLDCALQVAGKLIKNKRPCRAARAADDEQMGLQLWEASEQLVKASDRSHRSRSRAPQV